MIPGNAPPRLIEVVERFQAMRLVLDGTEQDTVFADLDEALRGCLPFCRPEMTTFFAGNA